MAIGARGDVLSKPDRRRTAGRETLSSRKRPPFFEKLLVAPLQARTALLFNAFRPSARPLIATASVRWWYRVTPRGSLQGSTDPDDADYRKKHNCDPNLPNEQADLLPSLWSGFQNVPAR